ncbi:Uncharacterised protein [Mycobacteroides abscessus subsp. massiliense]|uniref:hypothetical protein n=1 Tax=Mycobacteroides abscessus TaxID=36809 RepID=UPI0009A8A858|nr:hypothetical protein [Mycobacteroides abscessus]SKF34243.1 Uncharacterised protein [Mycobacteroides abscessus subsp. massiliense]SKF44811.1 Uncharacterised protein [Mycobacteroides abscessus subsp. massiliense]SKF46858.1 Uncharacterised protein [Mycobacteroides abscessus subsp. massiliense]SKF48789.1 Uncharacterised protein [Mycobacteroides abscessus subsp. massiliense]SKF49165.1 Uncharacterised protein [Mycobacteroides abscessus subsp. massiliense]
MNYPAALLVVSAVALYALGFLWRRRRPAFTAVDNYIEIAPLVESLVLATVLFAAGQLARPPAPLAAYTVKEAVARDLLAFLGNYVLPLVLLAVLLMGALPVLVSIHRSIFCKCPQCRPTAQNSVGSSE